MRFMAMIKATRETEAGVLPSEEMLTEMSRFNEVLVNAGVLLAGEGLQASSKGVRIRAKGSARTVVDGPFTETKELIAGFWIIQTASLDEAVERMKRCPNPGGAEFEIEIRPIFEADDFGDALTDEIREQNERLRLRSTAQER